MTANREKQHVQPGMGEEDGGGEKRFICGERGGGAGGMRADSTGS